MAFDISKFAGSVKVSESDTRLMEIPLSKIYENQQNFYPALPPEEYRALRDSIEANGLLEPLTVVADQDGKYRLISGHNRYRALTSLRDCQGDRWEQVSCLILPTMTEQQELSAIIEANRQRKKDGWLLAQEAERLTESYVARKKAGEELPGRIRQRVAEALQVSQTKLATVKAIEDHLRVPGFKTKWQAGDLTEDAAYAISKLSVEQQYRYLDWTVDNHQPATAKTVKEFLAESRRPKAAIPKSAAPEREQDPFATRLRALREDTGLSRAEFSEQIGECKATYSAWENGNLPGCDRMPKLAKALGVTTDYLFGLSDEPHGSAPIWQPLDAAHWPPVDSYILLRGMTSLSGRTYMAAVAAGGPDDRYPFEDASDRLEYSMEEINGCGLSEWMLLE